jgi:streptomycin 6-kinase
VIVPAPLVAACRDVAARQAWLASLPDTVIELERRWSLVVGDPYETASYSWVAPANRSDGTSAVLKLRMPHYEGDHEIDGLRFWSGESTVQLLEADRERGAMLLERCEPGTGLWKSPPEQQDLVLANLLKKLWRMPTAPHPFRPLSEMLAIWRERTVNDAAQWREPGLVCEGLRLLAELAEEAPTSVLLATDLHAGNVLRAQRKPWLAIDPRPFMGDPAYDATQHLLTSQQRMRSDPDAIIRRFADAADLDPVRVRLWTFARAAAQPRADWNADPLLEIARALTP